MTTTDRNHDMSTIDNSGTRPSVASPFFIGAVVMTIVLTVVAIAVVVAH